MSESINFAEIATAWAANEPSVKALVLIGSRVRPASDVIWSADAQSDWDFHLITSQPQMFLDAAWTNHLRGVQLQAYAARIARIGGVPKINAIFGGAEADFVVLHARAFRLLKMLTAMGVYKRSLRLRQKLQELAVVVRPGWRFLKGANTWEPLYQRAVSAVSDPRLSNAEACNIADGFVCDYVSIVHKIVRGELLAAQRLTHRDLAEANFRLLHELKLRRGERTFPEVRRIERIANDKELTSVAVNALVEGTALKHAVEKSAATCREMMSALVGNEWNWPKL